MTSEHISWNQEKNELLKKHRFVSFEDVIIAIEEGNLITIINNTSINFKDQKALVVLINNYIHIVPYIKNKQGLFLKTIFPSRKFNKIFNK